MGLLKTTREGPVGLQEGSKRAPRRAPGEASEVLAKLRLTEFGLMPAAAVLGTSGGPLGAPQDDQGGPSRAPRRFQEGPKAGPKTGSRGAL